MQLFCGWAPDSLGALVPPPAPGPISRVWPGEEVEIKGGKRRGQKKRKKGDEGKGEKGREAAHPQKFSEVGACVCSGNRMKPFMSIIVNLLSYLSDQNVSDPFSLLSFFLLILLLSHRFGRSP